MRAPDVAFERTMIKRAMNEVSTCGLFNRRIGIEPVPAVRCCQVERRLLNESIDRIDVEGAVPL